MKRILAPLLFGLIGAAILVALGTWQMQRLDWKRGILAEIDDRIAGTPAPLPRMISPSDQKYMPVTLTGTIEDKALFVLVSAKVVGAGWRVISAMTTADGRRVLLDRGFVPVADKSAPPRPDPVTVLGNLHWPDDRNASTPDNDEAKNTWFARDIARMAEVLDTEPLLVIARDITPPDPGLTVLPVDSAGIPNDHLQYAITWYSLAVVWLLMTGALIWRRSKED
ncbi:SURF1 family protein [Tropicibacter oceani]|uniref:SURF1-like protein n=1 Tax=Tropicibacter oceani TaxID=3058420 RepID=A0ABY8QHQ8_9RHOB|nr:SURF1 family protein [Tropicibacter oceani]WGW03498.1 SURF1 family protein [Tropicibacter oceani]